VGKMNWIAELQDLEERGSHAFLAFAICTLFVLFSPIFLLEVILGFICRGIGRVFNIR